MSWLDVAESDLALYRCGCAVVNNVDRTVTVTLCDQHKKEELLKLIREKYEAELKKIREKPPSPANISKKSQST